MSGKDNKDRLADILNEIAPEYAPERGLNAEYIALLLDDHGVTAPTSRAKTSAAKETAKEDDEDEDASSARRAKKKA